ncbi:MULTISPECIES: hypothetical protein [Acinetobacter]|uniref:Uncharacterized protein n=1 Tax=Acinetobacter indicus TaxID=756892 RepID=A0A6C0Y6G2_9GAMM|nr:MULTISPECIES: hypothetical protein [Acinetobacter]QIC71827.1 hypothetical protein FSC09_15670 [Acinetobacter indicus]QKQ71363.1 hypothetical protein E5Y90_14120 [Acinetobacter sp. 10FS3-1]
MWYFVNEGGLIAWVNEQGESNLPVIASGQVNAKIADGKVYLTAKDGSVHADYDLWNNLTALAVAVSGPIVEQNNMPMHIDTAVAIAHARIDQYRNDWYKGNQNEVKQKGTKEVDFYPMELPANNVGVFFEQMAQYVMNDIPN